MAEKGNVIPDCPNASNPYHECTEACLRKISQGETRKDKKKSGSLILDVSRSFGRKKKEGSQPNSPKVHDKVPFPTKSYSFDLASKKKAQAENGEGFPHSQARIKETYAQDPSVTKAQVQSSQAVPISGSLISPDVPTCAPKENSAHISGETPNNHVKDEKLFTSPHGVTNPVVDGMHGPGPAAGSRSFTFTGIAHASDDSDEEDVRSVISDSCVSVGKYHVKESYASILQSIFDKYGDIAASCQLESTSLRSYYLECVCSVVRELQSSSVIHLTKAKLKELLAILKDVESSQIDVSWLRGIISEFTANIELISQHRSIEVAKANCDRDLESTRKQLASQMEDLSLKEKEVAIAKEQVAATQAHLREVELKCSQLNETISSIRSKAENFRGRSLLDELC